MTLTADQRGRIEQERFLWLTTQTMEGRPWSVPVWFIVEGDEIQIFASPDSRKVGNLERNRLASVHTNADAGGHGFIELKVKLIALSRGVDPAALPAYVEKYREDIAAFGIPLEDYQHQFNAGIRLKITDAWVDA